MLTWRLFCSARRYRSHLQPQPFAEISLTVWVLNVLFRLLMMTEKGSWYSTGTQHGVKCCFMSSSFSIKAWSLITLAWRVSKLMTRKQLPLQKLAKRVVGCSTMPWSTSAICTWNLWRQQVLVADWHMLEFCRRNRLRLRLTSTATERIGSSWFASEMGGKEVNVTSWDDSSAALVIWRWCSNWVQSFPSRGSSKWTQPSRLLTTWKQNTKK